MKILKSLIVLCVVVVFCAKATKAEESAEDEEISPVAQQKILMAEYMDKSADPCDDFYQYACGNFERVNLRLGGKGYSGIDGGIDDILTNIFESEKETDNEVEKKVKQFYKTCVNADLFNFKKSDELVKVINGWGGFPAVDPDRSGSGSAWWRLTTELAALDLYGLIIDKDEVKAPALRLIPFGMLHKHNFREKNTTNNDVNIALMKKLMIMYGAAIEQADAAVDDILEFGERYQHVVDRSSPRIAYRSARSMCSGDYLICNFIKTLYKLHEDQLYFEITWDTGILEIWKFINKYSDKKSVYNYLILRALLEFHQDLIKPKNVKSFCASQVKKSFPFATNLMFFNSEHYNKNMEQEVLNMTENIRNEIIESIKAHDWNDIWIKEKAIGIINGIAVHIGFPTQKDWDSIAALYNNVTLTSDYFSNILLIKRNYRKHVNKDIKTRFEQFPTFLHDSMEAAYNGNINSIILTAGAFVPPFYFTGMPKSYNYAAIGVTIAHEFTPPLDGKYEERQLDWESDSHGNFKESYSCIEDYLSDVVQGPIKNDIFDKYAEIIADIEGMRHAYYAFQKDRDTDYVELKNDTLGLNENQFFFLSTAQLWCQSFNRKAALLLKDDNHAYDKNRVIETLSAFEEFGNAFNCPVGSKMKVEKRCKYW